MLRDVVRAVIERDAALQLVGPGRAAERDAVLSAGPDVVVAQTDDLSERVTHEILRAYPRARLVGISAESGAAVMYELRPHRVLLGTLGVDGLADALGRVGGER